MTAESEWKTRKERIDRKLTSLSTAWKLIQYHEGLDTSTLSGHAVEEYPTASGPADYALFVKGRLLGIIEAKKVGVNPQNVLEQAKRYAKGAFSGPGNWNGYRVHFPFPILSEQQEMVRRVEALYAIADHIEKRYNKAKGYLDKLNQSILAKAFRGELVPQDPDDEPAGVLQERINKQQTFKKREDKHNKTSNLLKSVELK